ncbi:MAG: TRAP transporter small permease subunit [Cellvibrionales bacterium]|nr:TRAP transporter small permease subunit [Cellvibrionales bacterium]
MNLAHRLIGWLDRLAEGVGGVLCWLCLLSMLVTCLLVAFRYLLPGGNIIFMQETVTYLHATVFLLAAGWTLKRGGHVRVDLFYRRFGVRARAWVDALGCLLFLLPVCALLFFSSLDFVALSWSIRETSADAGGVPLVYLLKTLIPVMSLLLAVQGLAELGKNALRLAGAGAGGVN